MPDLLESGIYTIAEAAYLVGISERKARGWISGYDKYKLIPMIENEIGWSGNHLALSFKNLLEMRFISFFEDAGVHINHIRSIMDEVRVITSTDHPFSTDIVFQTDGRKIVGSIIKKYSSPKIYDPRTKNLEMFPVVYDSLKHDIEFDFNGDARLWFPRKHIAPNVIIHPKFAFGKPIIKDFQIPTQAIASAVKVEGSQAAVAEIFDIPVKYVRQAVKFEAELRLAA
ncbi:hypothetical protein KPL78_02995 [Roseomonas sp. HJA6]|uniref:DUF433 domain-containing protein n=1 Tax=Roseomonas alba TaxID=2846776 RepID=A0ABS7A3C7_9PROT|nr:hypothetical protein [Neoroseomonas alba]MBW6396794.1 hypothetical protein [Neoroseomonas alba]